jgi:hypothetical protein
MTDTGPASPSKRRNVGVFNRPARANLKRRALLIALVVAAALALVTVVAAFVS